MKLFFFDLETTGVNPGKNGIHQISGEIVIDGKTMELFDFKVQPNPKCIIEEQALNVQIYRQIVLVVIITFSKTKKNEQEQVIRKSACQCS